MGNPITCYPSCDTDKIVDFQIPIDRSAASIKHLELTLKIKYVVVLYKTILVVALI